MGYVRMIRSGGLHFVSNSIRFVPDLDDLQVSISPTFYEQLSCAVLQFGLVIFWQKEIIEKAACKMLSNWSIVKIFKSLSCSFNRDISCFLTSQKVNLGSISPAHENNAILFHKQNCAQLNQYSQLEITPNFYALPSRLCIRKIRVNPLPKKLLVECWINWPLISGMSNSKHYLARTLSLNKEPKIDLRVTV